MLIPQNSLVLDAYSEQVIKSGKHYFEMKVPYDDNVFENMTIGLTSLGMNNEKVYLRSFVGSKGFDENRKMRECQMINGKFFIKKDFKKERASVRENKQFGSYRKAEDRNKQIDFDEEALKLFKKLGLPNPLD